MRKVFILRPEPASQQTVLKAQAMGLDAVPTPLFDLEALDWSPPDPRDFDGLLLTSANTLKMAGERLDNYRSLPVHAVGEGTAVAARVAGLGVATVGGGGVNALLDNVAPGARLLHLCGADRREPSVEGRSIMSVPVYRASEKHDVPGLQGLNGQVAILHSPRAARRLADLIQGENRASVRIGAISEATAAAAGEGWQEVRVAHSPNDTDLLALAVRLCET